MMRLHRFFLALVSIGATSVALAAQTSPDPGPVTTSGPMLLPPKAGMIGMHVEEMDAPAVKDAPFCASITTEHTQAFADGNRIHTTDSSTLCRDSEGRTRREAGLVMLGPAPNKVPTKLITIVDPVAGFRYLLDPTNKTAHKMPFKADSAGGAVKLGVPGKGEHFAVYHTSGGSVGDVVFQKKLEGSNETAPTIEKLGDQTIDGITATGTRVTTTIPSGQMGNDQPITVTSEQWYSSQLKATIMTKHSDPWAGELKTQFTNVNTSEPDSSLFTVPGDYKIVDEKIKAFSLQAPPPQP